MIGVDATDQIAFEALERFGLGTVHKQAAEIILERAEAMSEEIGAQTRMVLETHGMLDCERSMEFKPFNARTSRWGLPHFVEGFSSAGIPGLNTYVPAYKQFYIQPEQEYAAVRLQWSLSAGGGGFGGFGGGGSVSALSVAYQRGEPVRLETGRTLEINAEHIFEPTLNGETQTLTLAADCLPEVGEKAHLLLLNSSRDQLQIPTMRITYLDAAPDNDTVVTCGQDESCPDSGMTESDAGVDSEDDGTTTDPVDDGDSDPSSMDPSDPNDANSPND